MRLHQIIKEQRSLNTIEKLYFIWKLVSIYLLRSFSFLINDLVKTIYVLPCNGYSFSVNTCFFSIKIFQQLYLFYFEKCKCNLS